MDIDAGPRSVLHGRKIREPGMAAEVCLGMIIRCLPVLERAGVRNEVRWLEGKGHAAVLLFGGEAADAAINFLDAVLRE